MFPDRAKTAPPFTLLVIGRLHGVTRKRLSALLEQAGGRLATRPSAGVDLVALAHDSAATLLFQAPPLELPPCLNHDVTIISETALKRLLRVSPRPNETDRTLGQSDVLRASKLGTEVLGLLEAFDVVEPFHGMYAYRDVLVAREVNRLLDRGYGLDTIVSASISLRQTHASLCDARLIEAPWGEVVQDTCAGLARLDGQFVFPLSHNGPSCDDLFECAEIAEASNDLVAAERLYRKAAAIDRTDAVIPFNLGNVLDAQGRRPDAVRSYYEAVKRDPDFAVAWFNLGVIAEEEGHTSEAISRYYAAVSRQPDFADALFNLALLLTEREIYTEAASLWERFLAISPHGSDTARARRCATLCRLAQTALGGQPWEPKTKNRSGERTSVREALLC